MTLYCFVKNGEIVEGPRRLPNAYQNKDMHLSVTGLRKATDDWLIENGILPLSDNPPEYDSATQRLSDDGYDVQSNCVVALYSIVALTQDEIKEKANKVLGELKEAVNRYIYAHYDQGVQATMQAIYADPDRTDEQAAAIKSVWLWIKAVLSDYYQRKQAVEAGQSLDKDFADHDDDDPVVVLGELLGDD